jgi:hypothetical protein
VVSEITQEGKKSPAYFRIDQFDTETGEMVMTQYVDNYRISSVLRWFGGKHFLSKELIPLLPQYHCWADVFGGGAHMTVAKRRALLKYLMIRITSLSNSFWCYDQRNQNSFMH